MLRREFGPAEPFIPFEVSRPMGKSPDPRHSVCLADSGSFPIAGGSGEFHRGPGELAYGPVRPHQQKSQVPPRGFAATSPSGLATFGMNDASSPNHGNFTSPTSVFEHPAPASRKHVSEHFDSALNAPTLIIGSGISETSAAPHAHLDLDCVKARRS